MNTEEKLRAALQLAKDMLIANELYLPKTFEVIDEALTYDEYQKEQKMHNEIPVESAKELSTKYDYPEIVIFAYDPETGEQHVTTYGKSLKQSKDAAKAGNHLKLHLGWDKDKCNAVSSREADIELAELALSLANEYDAVPSIDQLNYVCNVFSDEQRPLVREALHKYQGYSCSDMGSVISKLIEG